MALINGYPILAWRAGMFQTPTMGQTYVYEHREVAGALLGRPLTAAETVHHEDEDRSNNDPANLFVFRTRADHRRYHASGIMIDMGDGTWTASSVATHCPCGRPRDSRRSRCQECRTAAQRASWPSADELRELVWAMPTVAVAARFGVSDVAIGKWCKALGVDKPPRGYWTRRSAGE